MQVREITVGVSEMLWGTGILLLRADGRHDRHSTAETDGHRRLNEWRLLCQHSPALPPPSVKSSRTLTDCQTKDTRRLTTTPRRAAPSARKNFTRIVSVSIELTVTAVAAVNYQVTGYRTRSIANKLKNLRQYYTYIVSTKIKPSCNFKSC